MLGRAAQRPRLHHVGAPRCDRAAAARLGRRGLGHGPRLRHHRRRRASGRSRSRRTAPRATTRPPASRRSTSATASRATWAGATSPSTRWPCCCPSREFVDPYGGVDDLAHRVLRTPGRPEDSFSDDPLRMMRAARFAAQLGFAVDPDVVAAMTAMADRIAIISAERVRDELVKLVCAPHPRARADAARGDRAGADRAARAAGAAAGTRRAPPPQGRLRAHPTVLEQAIDLEPRLATGPDLVVALRGADARHRQAADPAVRRRRHRSPSTTTTWSAPS